MRHLGISNVTAEHFAEALAIPGTGKLEHLEANVAAGALRLTPEEMTLLSAREATPR
jgi:pyridoxine 4-dehydrogenase